LRREKALASLALLQFVVLGWNWGSEMIGNIILSYAVVGVMTGVFVALGGVAGEGYVLVHRLVAGFISAILWPVAIPQMIRESEWWASTRSHTQRIFRTIYKNPSL
jgi:ABC-type phosphate transport system permease subunit